MVRFRSGLGQGSLVRRAPDQVPHERGGIDRAKAILEELDREAGHFARLTPKRPRRLQRGLPLRRFDDPLFLRFRLAAGCDLDKPTHLSLKLSARKDRVNYCVPASGHKRNPLFWWAVLAVSDHTIDHCHIRSSPRLPTSATKPLTPGRHLEYHTYIRDASPPCYKPRPVRAVDRALYVFFVAAITLAVARTFYGYMLFQTRGEWSAPLDDVFIHFDYARSTARGYPFQWSPGNGYSSGNTSLLYPFVLALGYAVGFRGSSLMVWAGIVACTSIFALLLVSARLFSVLPPWAKYAAPPAFFAIGALDWSLFSGMEVALFLGIWAGAMRAAMQAAEPSELRAVESAPGGDGSAPHRARWHDALTRWELGLWGLLLVLTRPEGATSIAALGLFAGDAVRRREGGRAGIMTLVRTGAPAVGALVVQALGNRLLTGEFAASGAIVKVTAYNPFMTAQEKLDEYLFLLKYVVVRNTEYHFSDGLPYGYIVPLLAAVPLFFPKTRPIALALWGSILSWLAIVAMNAQVRWQNERYTMPAVAWILLLAALGIALLVDPPTPFRIRPLADALTWKNAAFGLRIVAAALLTILFVRHQTPRMRDQIWFFGRASRNIRDQHILAGRMLKQITPPPRRILVGDAGALVYASDLPALDLIGLGGYHDLPFARASVHGLGATLELIERIAPAERPDFFAIYPSWWGDLPNWFGRQLTEVPVRGNVICGGSEKVIYRADWRALGTSDKPRTMRPEETVADELDVADLVNERDHDYEFPHPKAGFVDPRVLPDPADPRRDMFDAGRRIPSGLSETFRLKIAPGKRARLIARGAPEHDVDVQVLVDGEPLGAWHFSRAEGWQEASIDLPEPRASHRLRLTPEGGDWVDHHVWAVQVP